MLHSCLRNARKAKHWCNAKDYTSPKDREDTNNQKSTGTDDLPKWSWELTFLIFFILPNPQSPCKVLENPGEIPFLIHNQKYSKIWNVAITISRDWLDDLNHDTITKPNRQVMQNNRRFERKQHESIDNFFFFLPFAYFRRSLKKFLGGFPYQIRRSMWLFPTQKKIHDQISTGSKLCVFSECGATETIKSYKESYRDTEVKKPENRRSWRWNWRERRLRSSPVVWYISSLSIFLIFYSPPVSVSLGNTWSKQ
jgi:hypothetical protein